MKILSLNVHGLPFIVKNKEYNMKKISEEVLALVPDVVLFQEVWLPKVKRWLEEGLGSDYRVVEHVERYAVNLGFFKLRKSGLLAFTHKRYSSTPVTINEFKDKAPWYRVWEGDGIADKGIQEFVVSDPDPTSGFEELRFFNTHMQGQYDPKPHKQYQPIRESQVTQVRELTKGKTNFVFAGDFNIRVWEPLHARMTKGWTDINPGGPGKIDYIFYKGAKYIRVFAAEYVTHHTDHDIQYSEIKKIA